MQEFYQEGCRSPYLYLEAVKVLNRIPERMERLGEFELQRSGLERDMAMWRNR